MSEVRLQRYNMADGVTAFSTTRHGGYSEGAYGEMNINPFCGDLDDSVRQNKTLLAETLGIPSSHIVLPHQVHRIESRMIAPDFVSLPEGIRQSVLEGVDALVTDAPGICIGISTADCVPVLLYDKKHHAAAAVHAGWRGTLNRITHKTLIEMRSCYHTSPEDVVAVIGPAISLENFEVGQEVYEAFEQVGNDMSRIAKFYKKWHIDLPLCNQIQLEQAGVPTDNIILSGICTYERSDEYFSARKLGTASGRIYTGIILK